MSVKHIKKYYEQVCAQYSEMLNDLNELEEYAKTNLVEPELIDKYKEILKPLKDNWERWNYVIFLLNKPNKKTKAVKYNKSIKNQGKDVLDENNCVLNNLKNIRS